LQQERLEELLARGTDVPGIIEACLRPPLYATHFHEGFGTLYNAAQAGVGCADESNLRVRVHRGSQPSRCDLLESIPSMGRVIPRLLAVR
jgi:hypothetical protein